VRRRILADIYDKLGLVDGRLDAYSEEPEEGVELDGAAQEEPTGRLV
jgi:hypothetical protein